MTGILTHNRYWGSVNTVDQASNFSYSHLIRSTSNSEKLKAKDAYERVMGTYGHRVESYHADNSRFDSKEFKESCDMAQQTYSYCGVGANHQNGIAEAMNKKLSHGTRTSLLHAKRKWPDVISTILWPFCYNNVEERQNNLYLNADGMSPIEILLGHKEEIAAEDFHTWGCSVFVLHSSLQSGNDIGPPKWEPRARSGVYLGYSPAHAGNVALVFNLQTGHVSPQYHVVFDDEFTTVPYLQSTEAPPNWADLVENHTENAT